MKKLISLSLLLVVLMGAGCIKNTSQPSSQASNTTSATVEQTEKITTDTALWVRTDRSSGGNFSQNVSFLRPPEFVVKGDDRDYGRVTSLQVNDRLFIEIAENSNLLICPKFKKQNCQFLDELVSVSPEEYINTELSFKKLGTQVSDKKIGNLSDKVFINESGHTTVLVHFNGVVYRIIETRDEEERKDNFFEDLIASFKFGE